MARVFTPALLDHAEGLFQSGLHLAAIARQLGVNPDNLSKALRARGFKIPRVKMPSANRKDLPGEEIAALYSAGMSELELSRRFECSRTSIRRYLLEQGCNIRGRSEAAFVSASRLSPEFRKQRAKPAQDALRGAKRSKNELIARAVYAEQVGIAHRIGEGEELFDQALSDRGIPFKRQTRVDIYNVDFSVGSVAVELKKGRTSVQNARAEARKGRVKKLIDHGFAVLYVCFESERALQAGLEYVIAALHETRRNPPAPGQYRVVRCHFQRHARFRNEAGQFAAEATPEKLTCSMHDVDL